MLNSQDDLQSPKSSSSFVETKEIVFSYFSDFENNNTLALNKVSIKTFPGQHVAILGRNGSGKSTLAKLINGLLLPDQGEVFVLGKNTADESEIWSIRQICGMVFQNPDNQIVGTTVEEDVAFGPENLGVPSKEIRERVDLNLEKVGLSDYAKKAPSQLSGGQKQKLAIAGILAMKPQCIILDEATSMLDPQASKDLMTLISELKSEYNLTIIDITHDVENAINADYLYILQEGEILMQGTPRQVFSKPGKILSSGLELPKHLLMVYSLMNYYSGDTLRELEQKFKNGIFTVEDAIKAIQFLRKQPTIDLPEKIDDDQSSGKTKKAIISVKDLYFSYQKSTEHEIKALQGINFEINQGELIAIIGHSGSGKSTLVTHLNGLIVPQAGKVLINDLSTDNKQNIPEIRKRVGLLFQYPEHQLFENTVYEDIAFGPKQFNVPQAIIEKNINEAIKIVNIDKELLTRSPFELSGGQQRRVAIAGVIAMDCDIYVLDEPAAGLDPIGKNEILSYISKLRENGKTIILVSHDMNLVAELADRVMVLEDGKLVDFAKKEKIFSNDSLLESAGLEEPAIYKFSKKISTEFSTDLTGFTVNEVLAKLLHYIKSDTIESEFMKKDKSGGGYKDA